MNFYWESKTINSVHSPYLYKLLTHIFELRKTYYADTALETLRQKLKQDETVITFEDHGAGSHKTSSSKLIQKTVKTLAATSTSNVYKCRLLRNLTLYFRPKVIMELGTNLGLATSYLNAGSPEAELHTIEGAEPLYDLACNNFKELNIKVTAYLGLFDTVLHKVPEVLSRADFVYMDGDHTYESTIKYFEWIWRAGPEKQVIVMDDINWSSGMRGAWNQIKRDYHCRTIDFYKLGLVIKDPELTASDHIKFIPRILKPLSFGFFG